MTCSVSAVKKINEKRAVTAKIMKSLAITKSEAEKIFDMFKDVERPFQAHNLNLKWALGTIKNKDNKATTLKKFTAGSRVRRQGGVYVIRDYEVMGPVFDQGARGTCVANAAVSLIDYKGHRSFSRQFLYHQCKKTDGIEDQEGTFIETPFEILRDDKFADCGCIEEHVWPYNPERQNTEQQGPPPEQAFNTLRILSDECLSLNKGSMFDDIMTLLHSQTDGKNSPVVIGVPLYESFFSMETSRTGWTTMPLPGEQVVGYHAMLIVGYDESRRMFLVRNSWSSSWAAENDGGFPGHAWMPYEYITSFFFAPASILSAYHSTFYVKPEDRHSNRLNHQLPGIWKRAAAARKQSIGQKKKSVNRKDEKETKTSIDKKRKKKKLLRVFEVFLILLLIAIFHEQLLNLVNTAFAIAKEHIPLEEINARLLRLITSI